jgi:uncharacterized protein (TIGR03435 family)
VQRHPPGRFVAGRWSLRDLIAHAYDLPGDRLGNVFLLRGGDDAILAGRFTVDARLPGGVQSVPVDAERAMLRALLADRFGLKVHTESQVVPVYALRRESEVLGAEMRRLTIECAAERLALRPRRTDASGEEECGFHSGPTFESGFGQVVGASSDVAFLADMLQRWVDRPVVDETGLTGSFAWKVTFLPTGIAVSSGPMYPSLFTAVKEQLGLKLEATEAEVDVVVIDSVSMPTPN